VVCTWFIYVGCARCRFFLQLQLWLLLLEQLPCSYSVQPQPKNDSQSEQSSVFEAALGSPPNSVITFCLLIRYMSSPMMTRVGMKHIKKYVERMTHDNVSRGVLVLQQNPTPFAKSFLIELEPKIHLKVFQVSLHSRRLLQFDSFLAPHALVQ
jgi:hypothetical protein